MVALYAAEHTPWNQGEIDRLANVAARVAGLCVLGIPMEVSRLILPAEVHPEWKVRLAAVDRWSREVWISKYRLPGGAPPDALLDGELHWAWALAMDPGEAIPSSECPALAAVVAATQGFGLEWHGPCLLRCCSTGQEWDLREGSPAML